MPGASENWSRLILFVGLLGGLSLACNLPSRDVVPSQTSTPSKLELPGNERPATGGPGEEELTRASPATVPSFVETPKATKPGEAPSATSTRTMPTLAASHTPSHTPTTRPLPTNTPRPSATNSPDGSSPLTFDYRIEWRLNPDNAMEAIATVTIAASGGGGSYSYYSDDLPVDGPVFEYSWVSCKSRPGSLRVDSADGQSARVDYFENPPCPTPTPIP